MKRQIFYFSIFTLLTSTAILSQSDKILIEGALCVSGGFTVGAQSGNMPEYNMTDGLILTDSSGYLYGSGGILGGYSPNENLTAHINMAGSHFHRVAVCKMGLEDPNDVLRIYNDVTNILLAEITGMMFTTVESENPVRIEFTSNGSVQGEGFCLQWFGLYLDDVYPIGAGGRMEYISARNALRSGHVEGNHWDIQNVGEQSFATGTNVQAKGENTMAQGLETIAQAYVSTALGRYNVGGGSKMTWDENDPLFEIGIGTSNSLRENALTVMKNGRIGLGMTNPKTPFHIKAGQRVLWGADTLGNGTKLMWLPDLHAFRVGAVATGATSTYWDRDSIGQYSFAAGLNNRAQGFGATAFGRDTEATNSYAFASGFFTNADGQYSTAMGFNTDALALGSSAFGYSTDAEQNYSTAMGYFAEAQAIYSVAIGNAVRAQSYSSMAVGRYNVGGGSTEQWIPTDPIFEIGIGDGPSTRANAVTVRKNGNVGIGTTVPLDALHVNGRIRMQTVEYFEDAGTSEIKARGTLRPTSNNIYDLGTDDFRWDDVYATNGTINTSDARDKQNIGEIEYGLTEIMQLSPKRYRWKSNPKQGEKLGLLAQDVLQIIPEVVKTHDYTVSEEDESLTLVELDRYGIYYSDLIPVLIKGMQEQQEIIEALEQRIAELERL